ncbi:hypothetical protein MMC28_003318 [Mycoblastus sanguinarius]|nr:hypothetical protein [Mycoblastus sanguinarius]
MELYMCGFNAHHQLNHKEQHHDEEITRFEKVNRSPHVDVRCASWSSTVIESDGSLVHLGFRQSGLRPVWIDGPPLRNIKTIFGDTSGVLGALTTDGSVYLYHDDSGHGRSPELKKHRFNGESFLVQQGLAVEYLAIAENGEVCICTNTASRKRAHSGCTPVLTDETPQFTFSPPTAKIDIHTFTSFNHFLSCDPPTSSYPLTAPVVSLLASATAFTALTATQEVLTFGSLLHPQALGRTPTPARPANRPCSVPFLGGIPIRKVDVGGWIGAAVSEDRDLYIWGGRAGDSRRISALPSVPDEEEVQLVDIKGGVDVVDVGVGLGHVVALTGEGEVWVTGEADYGQLGTGEKEFEEDWVRVKGDWEGKGKVVGVGCGVWCSWVVVDMRAGAR